MKNLILISALLSVFSMSAVASDLPPCPSDQTKRYHNCYGAYTSDSGEKYIGEWKYNQRTGEGTYTFADGRIQSGVFENNKYLGTKEFVEAERRKEEAKRDAERRRYEAEKNQREMIYDNCIIDLMPSGANNELSRSIKDKCYRISENPSTWQKWKYSD